MTRPITKKRIVVVEDDPDIRDSYKLIINSSSQYDVVGAYESCEDCIAEIRKILPHIILMDIGLPGMNGVQGTAAIKKILPYVEIVIMSVYEDTELVFESLKNGASGYISKSSNYLELLNALDEICKGGAPMSSKIARMVVDDFHTSLHSPLSNREKEVLHHISHGKTYIQIAKEMGISKETAKTHTKNIYKKLHVNKKSAAISKAISEKIISR
ncbi:MAG: response regulator transcription factor [Cyclobacteriaceae bacterium]|nr:response regulator transcription factor [Cyclobacteriaceae bacterium]